jgi:hypothetical protein
MSESSPICEETLRGTILGAGGYKGYVFHIQELQKKLRENSVFNPIINFSVFVLVIVHGRGVWWQIYNQKVVSSCLAFTLFFLILLT